MVDKLIFSQLKNIIEKDANLRAQIGAPSDNVLNNILNLTERIVYKFTTSA